MSGRVMGGRRAGGQGTAHPASRGDRQAEAERRRFSPRFFVNHEPPEPAADREGKGTANQEVLLDADDSYHALKVLRVRAGDSCEVVTQSGRVYAGIVSSSTDPVRVKLVALLSGAAVGAVYTTQVGLVQALARPAAMDYVIEKATEVGASFFLLVPAGSSPPMALEAPTGRIARWRRVAREAAKQSKQTAVPWVDVVDSIGEGLERLADIGAVSIVLDPNTTCHLSEAVCKAVTHKELVKDEPAPEKRAGVSLWVGPEGGWTTAEMAEFSMAGLAVAKLGQSVLRTETAGPVAVAVTRLVLRDW